MRNRRNIFLATMAAFALAAATSLASAQEPGNNGAAKSKEPNAAAQSAKPMKPMHGAASEQAKPQNRAMSQGEAAKPGEPGKNAQAGPTGQKPGKMTQRINRGKKSAKANFGKRGHARMAEHNRLGKRTRMAEHNRHGRFAEHRAGTPQGRTAATAGQRPEGNAGMAKTEGQERGLQGLQGNAGPAAGGNVRLTTQQRTNLRQTVIDAPNAPRVGRVPFGVRVGTAIPGDFNVNFVPVPETLVTIDPAWGGYTYFVWRHDVVIVNPATRTIVAVLPV